MTASYAYDDGNILREIRGSAPLRYVHGPGIDEPLGVDDGTALSYLHADALGSVLTMTNATGEVTLTRRYDAWGNLELGASEPGYAFTGREWDPEVGLYYYRARYYDPKAGRFLSEDPLAFEAGANFYAYALSSPAVLRDPDGLCPRTFPMGDWTTAKTQGWPGSPTQTSTRYIGYLMKRSGRCCDGTEILDCEYAVLQATRIESRPGSANPRPTKFYPYNRIATLYVRYDCRTGQFTTPMRWESTARRRSR